MRSYYKTHRGTDRLVGRVVPDGEVLVFKRLLGSDTLGWDKGEHALQQVEGIGVGVGEERAEGLLRHERQVPHIVLGPRRSDTRQRLLVGGAEDVQDLVELVDIIATLEEWPPTEELSKDTAYRPNIDLREIRGQRGYMHRQSSGSTY